MNKRLFYGLLVFLSCIPAFLLFIFDYESFSIDSLYFLARLAGLTVLNLLLIQVFLGNYHHWLSTKTKFDVSEVHKFLGIFTGLLLITHPLIFIIETGMFSLILPSFIDANSVYVSLGIFAFYLILITVSTSSLRKYISFRTWKKIHYLNYVVLVLAFTHAFTIGSNIGFDKGYIGISLGIYYSIIALALIFSFTYRKMVLRKKFVIVKKVEEGKNITSLYYTSNNKFEWKAGQYALVTIKFEDGFKETHPFTISSSPSQGFVRQSIKACGKFTTKINELNTGTEVKLEGPYGSFILEDEEVVMIAGGIGITPLKSMIQESTDLKKNNKILLIYAARKMEDLAFYKELNECAQKNSNLKIIYTLSDEDSMEWHGEKARIDKAFLEKYIKNFEGKTFYLCAPEKMVIDLKKILIQIGIKEEKIKYELFSF